MAFAFALALSAPLHADRNMPSQASVQQAVQAARSDQAEQAYQYCLQTNVDDDEVDLCFHRVFYSPMELLFCRHVVFVNARPRPSARELIQCARDASAFAYRALMDARGGKEPAGDEG